MNNKYLVMQLNFTISCLSPPYLTTCKNAGRFWETLECPVREQNFQALTGQALILNNFVHFYG